MNFDLSILFKAVVSNFGKIVRASMATYSSWQKLRRSEQAAAEKSITHGIKKYPTETALGSYLRCVKERELIRARLGRLPSPREVPAFHAYMGEDHANERDLRLAWPHRMLMPDGTFGFVLGVMENVSLWTCFSQTMLYLLSAACVFLLAGIVPKLTMLQVVGRLGLAFFLVACSAVPMYQCASIRAAKRILYRRNRSC